MNKIMIRKVALRTSVGITIYCIVTALIFFTCLGNLSLAVVFFFIWSFISVLTLADYVTRSAADDHRKNKGIEKLTTTKEDNFKEA